VLRAWHDEDRPPFAAMNADPQVMEYYPALLTAAESDALVDRIERCFKDRGFGLWAVEVLGGARFAGYIGLWVPSFEAAFTPCVEIGWRLAPPVWGKGYASEGARASLTFAFDTLGLDEVVSMTTVANRRSRAVMERIGMTRDPADDFDHPNLAPGHPLRPHVLYRARRAT
jgi:ribosomal-protein-alanine N-acetyltransferase